MELLHKRRGHFLYRLFCLMFSVYYVLFQCIVYWTNFQIIHTFIYQKMLLLTLFYLFWKLLKASRTNILLSHIKKHYFILIINQSQSIKTIYFQIYYICTIKWDDSNLFLVYIFHDLLTHCNHSTTWHPEHMTLFPHSLD